MGPRGAPASSFAGSTLDGFAFTPSDAEDRAAGTLVTVFLYDQQKRMSQDQFLEVIDRDEAERRFRAALRLEPLEAERLLWRSASTGFSPRTSSLGGRAVVRPLELRRLHDPRGRHLRGVGRGGRARP